MRIESFIVASILSIFCVQGICQDDTVLVDIDTLTVEDMDRLGYRNYRTPRRMHTSRYSGNVQRPEDKTVHQDDIYPIGWSNDGKFAYIIEPYAENCDCYWVEFYIQDLATGEILWFYHYNNEVYERTYEHASPAEKDSLQKEFSCSYLKCAWYAEYPEFAKQLHEHGIFPDSERSYNRELEDDLKFSHTGITQKPGFTQVAVDFFFEHDVDTLKIHYDSPQKDLLGVNFHGYMNDPEVSDWNVAILSERVPGLDSSKTETWHYVVKGFYRNLELPYEKVPLTLPEPGYFVASDTLKDSYRKLKLVEQMTDRVSRLEEAQWLGLHGGSTDILNYDDHNPHLPYHYGYRKGKFRSSIQSNETTYYLDKSIGRHPDEFFIYGEENSDDHGVQRLTQLICYDIDTGEVSFWYDLSGLGARSYGGIRYVETEDSLLFLSFGTDTVMANQDPYGLLICMDMTTHAVIWQSEMQCANAPTFAIVNDMIIAGYTGKEKDYLTMVSKHNGRLLKKITMPEDIRWIFHGEDDRLHVRTSISSYEFDIVSTFFESY